MVDHQFLNRIGILVVQMIVKTNSLAKKLIVFTTVKVGLGFRVTSTLIEGRFFSFPFRDPSAFKK